MSKRLTVFSVMAVLCCLASNSMAITDDADILYVGPGEEYTLNGTHTYNQYVNIEGTLYVTGYNGSGTTGTLELIAPQITVSGIINGNGLGYRTAEGPGAIDTYPGGGGAYGGNGGASGWGNPGGTAYGTANGSDIQMGSGGASQTGGVGGPGGASVSLFANTSTISGLITVNGSQGTDFPSFGDGGGGGAGGGILVETISGTISGTLSANGGRGGNSNRRGGGGGGGGRIKIFYALSLNTGGATITYSGGAGGIGPSGNGSAGAAGTYYTEQILVDNDDYLIIPVGQIYNLDGAHSYNKLVQIDGTLEVNAYNGSGTTGTVELQAPAINVSGNINANGKGYGSNEGPGTGTPFGSGAGAGYGGRGGDSGHGGIGGLAYGTATGNDIDKGSGGSEGWNGGDPGYSGGAGGGQVILNGSALTISGAVTANGLQGNDCTWGAGGGSGGGILITSTDISISGTLSANGGRGGNSGGNWGGGGGAGGRIKLFSCCSADTTNATIAYSGGAGGSGSWNGSPGEQGTFYTEVDNPAPWRDTEATYQRWEFLTPDINPPADQLDNPYGTPQLNLLGHEWQPVWGGREGIWALSGTIKIRIPDRSNSGPESLKLIWLQVIWTSENPSIPEQMPLVTETSGPVAKPSAKYPDCTLEYYGGGNWMLSTYTIILKPNPEYEEITITGNVLVDKVVVETICIPGLRTADLNGDGKVDFADLAIFANHWLEGT